MELVLIYMSRLRLMKKNVVTKDLGQQGYDNNRI